MLVEAPVSKLMGIDWSTQVIKRMTGGEYFRIL